MSVCDPVTYSLRFQEYICGKVFTQVGHKVRPALIVALQVPKEEVHDYGAPAQTRVVDWAHQLQEVQEELAKKGLTVLHCGYMSKIQRALPKVDPASGRVDKSSSTASSWRRWWCLLLPDRLTYAEDKEQDEPTGMIPLSKIREVRLAKDEETSRDHVLIIKTRARTHKLAAMGHTEAMDWLGSMCKAVAAFREAPKNTSWWSTMTAQPNKDELSEEE